MSLVVARSWHRPDEGGGTPVVDCIVPVPAFDRQVDPDKVALRVGPEVDPTEAAMPERRWARQPAVIEGHDGMEEWEEAVSVSTAQLERDRPAVWPQNLDAHRHTLGTVIRP